MGKVIVEDEIVELRLQVAALETSVDALANVQDDHEEAIVEEQTVHPDCVRADSSVQWIQ